MARAVDAAMNVFLDDFGIFVGRKRNRFSIKKNGEVKEIVADDVDSIICCCSGVSFFSERIGTGYRKQHSSNLRQISRLALRCADACNFNRLRGSRREQFIAYNDERSVVLAKKFIAGKLVNQANF